MTLTFHIGYAKTATTFAQQHLYPSMENIGFAGRYVDGGKRIKAARWAYDLENLTNSELEKIAGELRSKANPNVLFSNEVLLRPHNIEQRLVKLKSFDKYADQVRIILSIRNPVDLIFSRYVHDITRGIFPSYSLEKALDFTGKQECLWPMCGDNMVNKLLRKSPLKGGSCLCNRHKVKSINVPYYHLDSTKQMLDSQFGSENVHFLVSERLKTNFQSEVDRLCTFLDSTIMTEKLEEIQTITSVNQRNKTNLYQSLKMENTQNGMLQQLQQHFKAHNERFIEQTGLEELHSIGYTD